MSMSQGYVHGYSNVAHKVVAEDTLANGKRVSTVWLGLDPPIFETMVFEGESWLDIDAMRYATEAEALAGHNEMVAKWSSAEAAT